jgi:6-pyruvoyltetrahydropterin/6-carboxytetrahydropterin synthase
MTIQKGEVLLTRREVFSASHRLHCPTWSTEQNLAKFDKCTQIHGHNYTLEVTLKGIPDPVEGMIINLHKLKEIIKEVVIDKVDHRFMNTDIDDFKGDHMPTTENMAITFWKWLQPHVPSGTLYRLKLIETENNWVEYFG